jgi:hypothetical protein
MVGAGASERVREEREWESEVSATKAHRMRGGLERLANNAALRLGHFFGRLDAMRRFAIERCCAVTKSRTGDQSPSFNIW